MNYKNSIKMLTCVYTCTWIIWLCYSNSDKSRITPGGLQQRNLHVTNVSLIKCIIKKYNTHLEPHSVPSILSTLEQ